MSSTKPTVILLHGLGRTSISMIYLGLRLRKSGYRVLNYGYPSRKLTIEEQARRLHEYLLINAQDSEISFVTHSLGSIIVRKFALLFHAQFKLRRAVMLGPPNQGSQTAREINKIKFAASILGPAFQELCDLDLESAADKIEVGIVAADIPGSAIIPLHLGKKNDGVISVEEASLLGAKDLIVLPGVHSFLMFSPPVIAQVEHFLRHGLFKLN